MKRLTKEQLGIYNRITDLQDERKNYAFNTGLFFAGTIGLGLLSVGTVMDGLPVVGYAFSSFTALSGLVTYSIFNLARDCKNEISELEKLIE